MIVNLWSILIIRGSTARKSLVLAVQLMSKITEKNKQIILEKR